MKSRFFKLALCVSILFSLVATSLFFAKSVSRRLDSALRSRIETLNAGLVKNFGISISYSSLSPSILTGIGIKGIALEDAKSGRTFLTVKKATVRYSLRQILKGNFGDAVSEVVVNTATADLLPDADFPLMDLLKSISLEGTEPFKVRVNNVRVTYTDAENDFFSLCTFRRIYVGRAFSNGKYSAGFTGTLSGRYGKNSFSSNVVLESSILNEIDNSSAVVQFFNTKFNSYSVSRIGFLGEYAGSVFKLKMLPVIPNLYAEAAYDTASKDARASIRCRDFRLSHIVSGIKPRTPADLVSSLLVSVSADASYNFDTKKLGYSSGGTVVVPESKGFDGITTVSYSLNGNESFVSIPYLNASSSFFEAEYSGGIYLKTVQPDGILTVKRFLLPNGESGSAEFFLEPFENGFMVFSPEILFGEKVFTAAQMVVAPQPDGYGFDFDVYDYSHAETGEPGVLKLTGNYLTASRFLQSNISAEGMYIDSLLETVSFFLGKSTSSFVKDIAPVFRTAIFSTDVYVSSYDGDFSYSIPSAIIADTDSDSNMLVLALDGNRENIQLRQLEFIFNDQRIRAEAHAENITDAASDGVNTALSGQIEYNEIPYAFSGLIGDGWISITGDYGLNFSMMTDSDTDSILGTFALNEFPVRLKRSAISLFADSSFSYNAADKFNLNISRFTVKGFDGLTDNSPAFSLTGTVNKDGAVFNEISFTDTSSNLIGNGSVNWTAENGNFARADYTVMLEDSLYNEKLELTGNVSNPMKNPFSVDALLNEYSVDTMITVSRFRTGRLAGNPFLPDTMDMNITLTGNLSNPMFFLSVPSGTILLNNTPFVFSLQATVIDREFEVESAYAKWGASEISNVSARFSLKDWLGLASCRAETAVMGKTISAPVDISVKGTKNGGEKIPGIFSIDISTQRLSGTLVRTSKPAFVHIDTAPDETKFYSSENIGVSGFVLKNGTFFAEVDNKLPLKMKIDGNVKDKNSDWRFSEITVNLAELLDAIDYDLIKLYEGTLIGEFKITGGKNGRGFDGEMQIVPAEFSMPEYFRNHARTEVIYVHLDKDRIYTPPTRCMLKRSPVDVTVIVDFSKLVFESVTILVKTVGNTYAPLNINMNQVHVKGNSQTDLEITVESNGVNVAGSIAVKDTTAEFGVSTITDVVSSFKQPVQDDSFNVQVDLDVTMESRVQVFYGSLLRGLIVPGSEVRFSYDSADDNIMTLDGDVPIRSGEIIYLNSSFYIKEGNITFSESDAGIDPYVSLTADNLEFDEDNNEVTISISIDHQKISALSPTLTSSPSKSREEIMELLGNFVSGNSGSMSEFALSAGDLTLQTMLMRKIETGLRDFLKFDILSIRTAVVQNTVKYAFMRDSDQQGINVSNFFDNTAVYIGKYINKDLYVDAMLRLSYNKGRVNDPSTLQGLIFKPEFGFELKSEFPSIPNIRWSLAPDLSDLSLSKIMIIPSMTLSWKFNF